jgi:hypothetical protein
VPATPNITLTAKLVDLSGVAAGTTANPAKLRIALVGYGPVIPEITGTATIDKPGPYFFFDTGAGIGGGSGVLLWGNDQITPSGTFYEIAVLDGNDNVVQCGAYQFTGGPLTIDLSNATQIVPPYGFPLSTLAYRACSGAIPGTNYLAPGNVIAAVYNGVFLRPGIDYTVTTGVNIALSFTTQIGDTVYALCVV